MSKFSLEKKGYNTEQVDDYINNLFLKYEEKLAEQKDRVQTLKIKLSQSEEQLNRYIEKDKQISKALVYAVEKADEIESGAKKIYELEIKRVRLLYKRWEELLLEVESKYPQINNNSYIHSLIETFKDSIEDVLAQNFNLSGGVTSSTIKSNLKEKGDNYIKNILNKMDYAFSEPKQTDKKPNTVISEEVRKSEIKKLNLSDVVQSHSEENSRMKAINNELNKISNQKTKSAVSPIDEFLNSELDDEFANNAYAKSFKKKKTKQPSPFNYAYPTPNESGFDLEEALNPKEDLLEIMKTFDFFNDHNENE